MASKHRARWRWLAAATGVALAVMAMPVTLCENAIHIPARARFQPQAAVSDAVARETGADWQAVEIAAADGAVLRAWCFTPRRSARDAVILLHGVADTRCGVLGQTRMRLRHDFTVLTPDARGHGVSGGDPISYGLRETDDLHRWADWLRQRQHVDHVLRVGRIDGSGHPVAVIARRAALPAVVAECPFATFEEVAYDRLRQFA